jgi:pilus assembly protein CpaE
MTDAPIATHHTGARIAAPAVQVFTRDREAEGIIQQSLSTLNAPDVDVVHGDITTAIATLAEQPSPKLLIVDVSNVADTVARVNELAEVCEPNTGVIIIGERNDIVLYRDLKLAGVVEYFFKPLVTDLVTRACNSVLTGVAAPQPTRTGKLVFILGVRGGVGATTIAVNTAWQLAQTRQRWVILLDLDLQGGDAALQLDQTPSHALREVVENPERLDKLFLERAVIPVERRIDLLASLEPIGEKITFDDDAVGTLFDGLLHRYRFTFVDIPPTVAAQLIQALRLPSICVLVSSGSLVSAREVARWRELLGPNTPERTVLHILNKHGAPDSLSDAEFARAAGRAPDVVIPYDREIATASILGIKGTQKCVALKRGLAPLLRHLSGERVGTHRSILGRIFG